MDAIIDSFRFAAERTPRDLFDLSPPCGPGYECGLSRARLRDKVATMIVAGHETTTLALFWALYLLASAPDAQEEIAREVRGVDLGPDAAGEALQNLPFTRAVANEALRSTHRPSSSHARLGRQLRRCRSQPARWS